MACQVRYDVHNKPSKDRLGITGIFERRWEHGKGNAFIDVPMGRLEKTRGGQYKAIMAANNMETEVGSFDTRAQGGHAIRKLFVKSQELA